MQLKLKYNLVKVTHCHKKGKKSVMRGSSNSLNH